MQENEQPVTIYQVGRPFEAGRSWQEGVMYTYRHNTHQYLLLLNNIRASELQAFTFGQTHFGLWVSGDVIWMHFKADHPRPDQTGIPWQSAPYSIHLCHPDERQLPPQPESIPQGLGAVINLFLIEAASGLIVAMRCVNISHHFTRELYQAIYAQAARPFSPAAYDRQIEAAYEQHPKASQLAEQYRARCLGGFYEGESQTDEK